MSLNTSSSDCVSDDSGVLRAVTLLSVITGFGYLCYRAGCWLEAWMNNELSFPPKCEDSQQIFHTSDSMTSCNIFGYGLLFMLTGNDLHVTDYALGHHDGYQFDTEAPVADKVHLLVYAWDEPSPWLSTETSLCHICVYYKGYLYQAYRTSRYRYTTLPRDAYPPVRMALPAGLCELLVFRPDKLSVEQFNDWCAPRSHPIAKDAPLKLQRRYAAVCSPAKEVFSVRLSTGHWFG